MDFTFQVYNQIMVDSCSVDVRVDSNTLNSSLNDVKLNLLLIAYYIEQSSQISSGKQFEVTINVSCLRATVPPLISPKQPYLSATIFNKCPNSKLNADPLTMSKSSNKMDG